MILYRALNTTDYQNYLNLKGIKCAIDCKNIKDIIFDEIHTKEFSLSLDRIIGHISGNSISCWISTSSDFNFVASEYAIPQAGNYNNYQYRKNIAIINTDNEMKNLTPKNRNDESSKYIGKYVDLTQGKLQKLADRGILMKLSKNDKSYYSKRSDVVLKNFLDEINNKTKLNIQGFSNFATGANEYLFYREIFQQDIIKVLSPLEQDLIYVETCEKSIKEVNIIVNQCLKKYQNLDLMNYNFTNEEIEIFNYMYVENEQGLYNSLINLVEDYYSENCSVAKLYDELKNIKRSILSKITGLSEIPLLDDEIYAIDYQNIKDEILPNGKKITKKNKNDIIYQVDEDKKLVRNRCKKRKCV